MEKGHDLGSFYCKPCMITFGLILEPDYSPAEIEEAGHNLKEGKKVFCPFCGILLEE
jgi:hypothetical protein